MLYVVFSPFSVLLELSFLKVVPQETLGILINNYALFISTLDYSRKWKLFSAHFMFHIFAFSRNLCYAFLSFTVVNYNYVWEGEGISFLHFFTMKKEKKNSPIKLITANDLSLCQVSLLLHKLKFAIFFLSFVTKNK